MSNPEIPKESEWVTIRDELSNLHAEVDQSISSQSDVVKQQDVSLDAENEQEESGEDFDKISLLEQWDPSVYQEYLKGLEEHPEIAKFLQIYENSWKKYLIVPLLSKQWKENTTYVNLTAYPLNNTNWKYEIWDQKLASTSNHYLFRKDGCLSVRLEWDHYVSMNRWTGEITDVDPLQYKSDSEEVLDSLWKLDNSKQFSECSPEMQQCAREILDWEKPLEMAQSDFDEDRKGVADCIRKWEIIWAIKGIFNMVKSIIASKPLSNRQLWIGKNLNYSGDESDLPYLESAINNILDPEKRSEFTYLLSQIKDKVTKSDLQSKWIENPTQIDLFLQNCEPWQLLLTNGKDKKDRAKFNLFNAATQIVSWSRWCHAAVISDVKRNDKWVVTDVTIIHAHENSIKKWVQEISFRDFINDGYSCSDFLLASFPNENISNNIIDATRRHMWEKYDAYSVVMDVFNEEDVDGWKNGKSYCSELVFDAMSQCWCEMPKPHIAPADLLASWDITPKYACYCESF